MADAVLVDVADGVMTVTINRPEAKNAANKAVAEGIAAAMDRLDGSDGLPGTGFADLQQLQDVVLSSAVLTERLARETVLSSLCPLGTLLSSSLATVDVSEACSILEAWDGSLNLDSVGGHIWREFWKLSLIPI